MASASRSFETHAGALPAARWGLRSFGELPTKMCGILSCSPLAEAHVPSLGLATRHAAGCLRPGRSWRGPSRFTGSSREDGRYARREFLGLESNGDASGLRSSVRRLAARTAKTSRT